MEALILFSAGAVPKHFRNFYISLSKRNSHTLFGDCSDSSAGPALQSCFLHSLGDELQQPVAGVSGRGPVAVTGAAAAKTHACGYGQDNLQKQQRAGYTGNRNAKLEVEEEIWCDGDLIPFSPWSQLDYPDLHRADYHARKRGPGRCCPRLAARLKLGALAARRVDAGLCPWGQADTFPRPRGPRARPQSGQLRRPQLQLPAVR